MYGALDSPDADPHAEAEREHEHDWYQVVNNRVCCQRLCADHPCRKASHFPEPPLTHRQNSRQTQTKKLNHPPNLNRFQVKPRPRRGVVGAEVADIEPCDQRTSPLRRTQRKAHPIEAQPEVLHKQQQKEWLQRSNDHSDARQRPDHGLRREEALLHLEDDGSRH